MKYDIFPVKGSFLPGEQPEFFVEGAEAAERIKLSVYSGPELLFQTEAELTADRRIRLTREKTQLEALPEGGYGLKAELYERTTVLAEAWTAFDIMPEGKVLRYGFLSDFTESDDGEEDVVSMLKLHINAVQFYDWSYRHDQLVAPTDAFEDMMGKKNNLTVIKKKVEACYRFGMKAIGYGAVYAASEAYREQHPQQCLYDRNGKPLCFIDIFYIMNVAAGNGWHDHIIEQYRQAVVRMGFDGIHMDTYGDPKRALDAEGRAVFLEDHFGTLINDTKAALSAEKDGITLIFNNVGGWPVEHTMDAEQAAVYIEVWPPNVSYAHLGNLIAAAKRSQKPVILAAYPASFRLDTPESALESQLFLSYVIAMHGGTQLFFGEKNAVITQGYYVDYTVLNDWQLSAIRAYQDFFVRYSSCFYDPELEDVSMTHQGWDNQEYRFSPEGSADGEGGKIWYHIRQNRKRQIVYLVNLSENNNLWNEGKKSPAGPKEISAEIQVLEKPKAVWFAEPGKDHNNAEMIPWEWQERKQSAVVCAKVMVERCGLLVIENQ